MVEQKPVIFLAFANNRVDFLRYLRNLPQELRGIRDVLDKAVKAGLCEVVERSDAALEDIVKVFQDVSYKDRIAVFHYGGHADSYRLLLESIEGKPGPAYREGLVEFFAGQKELQLIFLNGCSTQPHALDLNNAGIPAVIATSQNIKDKVAAGLAISFYNGIANGFSLERAWRDAIAYIKSKKDPSAYRHLNQGGKKSEGDFPWDIHIKEGAEQVKEWNLPDAVANPLFGIPGIPANYGWPETPFLYLQRFEEEHARVFFGRGEYIRRLYNRVVDPGAPPIILFYGQSGVGKSSLLEAGLIPRLKDTHEVVYAARDQQKGLLRTLEDSLVKNYKLQNTNYKRNRVFASLCRRQNFVGRNRSLCDFHKRF